MEFNLEETLSNTPSNTYELIFSVGDGFLTFNHLSVLEVFFQPDLFYSHYLEYPANLNQ